MPFRRVDWPWAYHKLEGTGPTIDDAVIIPNTPIDEVRAFVDTPHKLAAWFGTTIDSDHRTLKLARAPDTLTVALIDMDVIDQGRSLTLTGVIASGRVRSYVSTRTVARHRDRPRFRRDRGQLRHRDLDPHRPPPTDTPGRGQAPHRRHPLRQPPPAQRARHLNLAAESGPRPPNTSGPGSRWRSWGLLCVGGGNDEVVWRSFAFTLCSCR